MNRKGKIRRSRKKKPKKKSRLQRTLEAA